MTEHESNKLDPESFLSNENSPELTKRREAYFNKIVENLGFNVENNEDEVSVDLGKIVYFAAEGEAKQGTDYVSILKIRGVPVACVLETADDKGYVHFNASYLTPKSIQGLEKI